MTYSDKNDILNINVKCMHNVKKYSNSNTVCDIFEPKNMASNNIEALNLSLELASTKRK